MSLTEDDTRRNKRFGLKPAIHKKARSRPVNQGLENTRNTSHLATGLLLVILPIMVEDPVDQLVMIVLALFVGPVLGREELVQVAFLTDQPSFKKGLEGKGIGVSIVVVPS